MVYFIIFIIPVGLAIIGLIIFGGVYMIGSRSKVSIGSPLDNSFLDYVYGKSGTTLPTPISQPKTLTIEERLSQIESKLDDIKEQLPRRPSFKTGPR